MTWADQSTYYNENTAALYPQATYGYTPTGSPGCGSGNATGMGCGCGCSGGGDSILRQCGFIDAGGSINWVAVALLAGALWFVFGGKESR